MKQQRVSVLIPAYNAAPYLAQTIESVLMQTWADVEVIIIDDGSADDTLAVAQRYVSANVQVVSQPNAGASAARNRAFSVATGEYIQYLDADDMLHPDKIRAQLVCLQQRPGAQLSSSAWAMFYDVPIEQELLPTILWQDYDNTTQWLVDAWENGVWMQPSAWLTHRALILAAGPWNEQLSLHDDGEFFSRVLLCSDQVVFCAEAKSFYRKGIADSLSSIRSKKATLSHLAVCQSYEQNLLGRHDNARMRQVCANNYQRMVYEYYPLHSSVCQSAATRIQELGGSNVKPQSTPFFQLINKLLGWRLSKRLQNIIYKHKLNPASWLIGKK